MARIAYSVFWDTLSMLEPSEDTVTAGQTGVNGPPGPGQRAFPPCG
jgi:hypothetical protein